MAFRKRGMRILNVPIILVWIGLLAGLGLQSASQAQGAPQRLGDFRVEWYCNQRGYGVMLVNNQADWACTRPDGTLAFTLTTADFDAICRSTYQNPLAFAMRDQNRPIAAHNWSCYVIVVSPTATPTPVPVRLGEFRVEWYCNEKGFGTALTNGDRDWACTNPNNSQIVFVLGQADLDSICQRTYRSVAAYALRDLNKAVQAYNWSCYMPGQPATPSATPRGITRLGEVRAAWYCTPLGFGALFQNDDWACTRPGTTITVRFVRQPEFDSVCRSMFRDSAVFAVREALDAGLGGYRWACYRNDALVTFTPVPSPTPTPTLVRLGTFQVEWYCNNQGYGVRLANENRDWACTFPNSTQIAFVLNQTHFNAICQTTYQDSKAFALKDQNNPTPAYNWSCYTYR